MITKHHSKVFDTLCAVDAGEPLPSMGEEGWRVFKGTVSVVAPEDVATHPNPVPVLAPDEVFSEDMHTFMRQYLALFQKRHPGLDVLPPYSDEEVAAWEVANDLSLPPDLRFYLVNISRRVPLCPDPGYGSVFPLYTTSAAMEYLNEHRTFPEEHPLFEGGKTYCGGGYKQDPWTTLSGARFKLAQWEAMHHPPEVQIYSKPGRRKLFSVDDSDGLTSFTDAVMTAMGERISANEEAFLKRRRYLGQFDPFAARIPAAVVPTSDLFRQETNTDLALADLGAGAGWTLFTRGPLAGVVLDYGSLYFGGSYNYSCYFPSFEDALRVCGDYAWDEPAHCAVRHTVRWQVANIPFIEGVEAVLDAMVEHDFDRARAVIASYVHGGGDSVLPGVVPRLYEGVLYTNPLALGVRVGAPLDIMQALTEKWRMPWEDGLQVNHRKQGTCVHGPLCAALLQRNYAYVKLAASSGIHDDQRFLFNELEWILELAPLMSLPPDFIKSVIAAYLDAHRRNWFDDAVSWTVKKIAKRRHGPDGGVDPVLVAVSDFFQRRFC